MCSLTTIEFIVVSMPMTAWGLPHSDIAGSSLLSSSPTLFAALHVLHRLWNQGIHLHALIKFLLTQNCTTGHGLSDGRSHVCFVTHESSSLYSFQRSLAAGALYGEPSASYRDLRPRIERILRVEFSGTFVPSRLNSAGETRRRCLRPYDRDDR